MDNGKYGQVTNVNKAEEKVHEKQVYATDNVQKRMTVRTYMKNILEVCILGRAYLEVFILCSSHHGYIVLVTEFPRGK